MQALDALTYVGDAKEIYSDTIESLRARLAQPEQEPVAWLYKKKDGMQVITDDPDYADGTWIPLYTAPPQREWQSLTDEEYTTIMQQADHDAAKTGSVFQNWRYAIEAKLKEKNHG